MRIKPLHDWSFEYAQARQLQEKLAAQVQHRPLTGKPKRVAGLDCAFSKDKKRICAAIIVLSFPDLQEVETTFAVDSVRIPYIPGMLSFREAPVCIAAAEKLKSRPDVFIVDGQGIAHPRRLGLAAHLGLFLDRPTIGCAKSRLIGQHDEPAAEKGSWVPLTDDGERIGRVLRTRSQIKPVYVSTGHKITLEDATDLVLQCCTRYRLPEPTRRAHHRVTEYRPQ